MDPREFFRNCPRCGAAQPAVSRRSFFECVACGFHYYFNAAVAVAVYVERSDGMALLIRRAREPARGKLSPPGGFIDIGETAETAAHREVREEVGLVIEKLRFLASYPNEYLYREITYPVLDFFFTAHTDSAETVAAAEEVDGIMWVKPEALDSQLLAFPSMQASWPDYLKRRSEKS
jgi:NAD+ diphosphatase